MSILSRSRAALPVNLRVYPALGPKLFPNCLGVYDFVTALLDIFYPFPYQLQIKKVKIGRQGFLDDRALLFPEFIGY